MPAGEDLITWNPRVGDAGNDRYDVPPCTPITAGPNAYSNPPTIAEINAGSGLNQVIAEVLRRIALTYGYIAPPDYVEAGDRITPSVWNTCKNAISTLEGYEQRSGSGWSGTQFPLSSGDVPKRVDLLALRKALATDHIFVPWILNDEQEYYGVWDDGGTKRVMAFHPASVGLSTYGGGRYFRPYFCFNIPLGLPSLGPSKFRATLEHRYTFTRTHELYRSDAYLAPVRSAHWGHLDHLEDSILSTDIPPDLAYTELNINGAALGPGGVTYIMATAGAPTGTEGDYVWYEGSSYLPNLKLYTS